VDGHPFISSRPSIKLMYDMVKRIDALRRMEMATAKRLRDAANACQELEQFTAGHTRPSFRSDRGLQLIVQKLLEITGEALNAAAHLDSTVSDRIPEHRRIVAMRNRITHGYDSVDIDVLWSTVRLGIPELHGTPVALLEDAPGLPPGALE
jgi:uncharacterized protein with HEPN domain